MLSFVAFLIKTLFELICFTSSQLAGKLDTLEWKLVLLFSFFLVAPLAIFYETIVDSNLEIISKYSRILLLLFFIQFICEYGDNYWEHLTFFRHRYSFESLTLALLLLFQSLEAFEVKVIQVVIHASMIIRYYISRYCLFF